MIKLVVGSVFAVACSSSPARVAPTVPTAVPRVQPAACVARPDAIALFQVATESIGINPASIALFTLHGNGAWSYESTRGGVRATPKSGCLAAEQVAALTAALEPAPWRFDHAHSSCRAIATATTVYRYKGTLELERHLCDAKIVDPVTEAGLGTALRIVAPISS